jgi:hypothetical protein
MPVIFIVHVIEEGPRFVAWFNSLVTPTISQSLFLSVNAVGLVITLVVAFVVAASHEPASGLIGVAWVGLLMLANGLFHIVGAVALGRYCPGVVTATLLYLPFSLLFFRGAVRELGLSWLAVGAVALLGGAPMYIHGYLIVFRGSRLF